MHLDAHERALRAANQCLRPFGVALQHLSFGPLEGLVLEVFPVLGSGVDARAADPDWELRNTPVPAMQAELRVGQYVDRASENDALNSYPDEWFESVQAYVDAIKRHRGWLGVSDMRAKWSAAPRALDPPPVVNARFAAVAGAPAGRATFLLDSELAATANIAATLSCKPVLQTFWSQTDEGAWFEKKEWSLRGVAPYHIRANVARAAHELDALPENMVAFVDGEGLLALLPADGERVADGAGDARGATRGVVVVDAQPASDDADAEAPAPSAPSSQQLVTFSEEAFTLPAALDEMLAELKEYLRSHNVATYRLTSAELVDTAAHALGARARHPDAFAARAPAPLEERARLAWDALQELSDESDDDLGAANVRPPPPLLSRLSSSLRRTQSEDHERLLGEVEMKDAAAADEGKADEEVHTPLNS